MKKINELLEKAELEDQEKEIIWKILNDGEAQIKKQKDEIDLLKNIFT